MRAVVFFALLAAAVATAHPLHSFPRKEGSDPSGNCGGEGILPKRTELDDYVSVVDDVYGWTNSNASFTFPGYTAHFFNLTSLRYLTPELTDRSIWTHTMIYIIPTKVNPACDTALIYATWGKNGKPWKDDIQYDTDIAVASQAALASGCPAIALYEIPNQNLCFFDVPGKPFCGSEDSIIGYSFNRYLYQNKSADWLLLFPMVKATIRAMDAITDISATVFNNPAITKFVIAGASKRGWTTWLVGSVDPVPGRIRAIIPFVLDAIGFRSFLDRQWESYQGYTFALQPYVDQGLATAPVARPTEYARWAWNIDPYCYRQRLTMPKLAMNSVGDEFQLIDDQRTWAHEMPGEMKTILLKDADHMMVTNFGLVVKAFTGFYNSIIYGRPRPTYTWSIDDVSGMITLNSSVTPSSVDIIYQHTPTTLRDWRDVVRNATCEIKLMGECLRFVFWNSNSVTIQPGQTVFQANLPEATPAGHFTAFYIQVTYDESITGGMPQVYASPASVLPKAYPFAPCGANCQAIYV